jgi:hypothetical protein
MGKILNLGQGDHSMSQSKTRTYTGVFYPEEGAAPLVPLIQHMKTTGLPGIISPIHSGDEEQSKPHVHFMVDYPNPVRLETVRSDYGAVAANGYLEPVRARKQMMRYFLHLDDPDKEQNLDPTDVITIGGAVFDTTPDLTSEDIYRIMLEIQTFIFEENVKEYYDLCRMLQINEKHDWLKVAMSHTIHYNAYLRSLRHKADNNGG